LKEENISRRFADWDLPFVRRSLIVALQMKGLRRKNAQPELLKLVSKSY